MSKQDVSFTMNLLNNKPNLPNKQVLASLKHLRSELKVGKDRGVPQDQLDKIKSLGLEAIANDLYEANTAERERLRGELDRVKQFSEQQYTKNYESNFRKLEDTKRRYSSMSRKELEAESIKIMGNALPSDYDPRILEELSIQLKQSKSSRFEAFRSYLKNQNYSEPYLHSELGKELDADLRALIYSPDALLVKTEDGRRGALSIEQVIDLLDIEEGEA